MFLNHTLYSFFEGERAKVKAQSFFKLNNIHLSLVKILEIIIDLITIALDYIIINRKKEGN